MYQGASSGAQRQSTPKKRRTRKKKNPTPVTWILIAGGVAVATGAGLGIYAYRKRRQSGVLPPAPGPSTGGGGGGKNTGGGGGAKQNAPAFPFTVSEVRDLEQYGALQVVANHCDPSVGELTQSVDKLTDQIFYEIYQIRKIPSSGSRGSGWQPYIDSWVRIRDDVRNQAALQQCPA